MNKVEKLGKSDLVAQVAEVTGLSKKAAQEAVSATLDTISGSLAKGVAVGIVGFGTFSVKHRAERTGRNPQTGAPITISAATVPAFKASSKLKSEVNS